jgi:hypothetical protein
VTQPSGPQFVILTDIGLPERGMRGVYSGAAAITARTAASTASCAARSR